MFKAVGESICRKKINEVDFLFSIKRIWDVNKIKLSELEFENYSRIKSPSRKVEFLGVRVLKNQIHPEFELTYLTNGKPVLNNALVQVSISHSRNFIAFASASHAIGIDIEECNERILKVKDRFLNDSEKKIFNQNSIVELTIAWCAKEAMFKLNKNDGINFKSDLIITKWDKTSKMSAKMLENLEWKNVDLYVEKIDNLVICFNFE